jgi:hypothetical protein
MDIQKMEAGLKEAFARFEMENPEAAEAMRALNLSYAEYLRIQFGLTPELQSVSGNARS